MTRGFMRLSSDAHGTRHPREEGFPIRSRGNRASVPARVELAGRVDPALVFELLTERTRDVPGQAEPLGLRRRSSETQLLLVDRDADLGRRHEQS